MFLVSMVKRNYLQVVRFGCLAVPRAIHCKTSILHYRWWLIHLTMYQQQQQMPSCSTGGDTLSGYTTNIFQAPPVVKQPSGSRELSKDTISKVFQWFLNRLSILFHFTCSTCFVTVVYLWGLQSMSNRDWRVVWIWLTSTGYRSHKATKRVQPQKGSSHKKGPATNRVQPQKGSRGHLSGKWFRHSTFPTSRKDLSQCVC